MNKMNKQYECCLGSELFTASGRRILDFLSGYCVHNAGHNHPAVIAALKTELDRNGPGMLQSHVPEPAAGLASRLVARAGGEGPLDDFVTAIRDVIECAHSSAGFWSEALGLARRTVDI